MSENKTDRHARWLTTLLVATAVGSLLSACAVKPADDDEDYESPAGSEPCGLPMSQGLSEACCPGHGIDACGAGLFCAAFDGRTEHTCYAERSRFDQTECREDRHCVSGGCNVEMGLCRSTPMTSCSPEVGCAIDPSGDRYVCNTLEDSTCQRIGDGEIRDTCETDADCTTGPCVGFACKATIGNECWDPSDCIEGECRYCSDYSVYCDSYEYSSQCLLRCGTGYDIYYAPSCA